MKEVARVRRTIVAVLGALMLVAVPALAADIEIIPINESLLPPSLSPMSYNNSPINYQNSIYNYKNSSLNYTNSSMNYVNSPANRLNGRDGNRRLIYQWEEGYLYVGYYVWADGPMNFFSPSGTRMFYSPSGTDAVFDGHNGAFCGGLYYIDGMAFLLLTEKGQAVMRDEGVPIP